MKFDSIESFLAELARCEWDTDSMNYNGICDKKGELYYRSFLDSMRMEAEKSVVELHEQKMDAVIAIFSRRIDSIIDSSYDVPSKEAIESYEREYRCTSNPSIKDLINLGYYVRNMSELQKAFASQFASFLRAILVGVSVSNSVEDGKDKKDDAQTSVWVNYKNLISRFDGVGIKQANRKEWRDKVGFPCKQQGEGCTLLFNINEVESWLEKKKSKKSQRKSLKNC